jgi:hypothetical protein
LNSVAARAQFSSRVIGGRSRARALRALVRHPSSVGRPRRA